MLQKLERNPPVIWFLILIYLSLIFYLSSIPYFTQPTSLKEVKDVAIVEHIIEFSILGFLLVPGFKSLGFKRFLILALALGIIYGISDEIHQSFVPGRDACLMDVMANSLGVLAGTSVATKVRKVSLSSLWPF